MNLCRTPPSLKYMSGAPGWQCLQIYSDDDTSDFCQVTGVILEETKQ